MRVIWLLTCLVTIRLLLELTTASDVQIATSLDIEQYAMDANAASMNLHKEELSEAMDISDNMGSAKILKKASMLKKVGSFLKGALNAVHAASAIAGFIFAIFMPQDDIQGLINKRFKEVNAKLDRLDSKLDEMQKSVKANVAFNVFLSQWMAWEKTIENGQLKLGKIRREMSQTTDSRRKVKLAEEYVLYYERNKISDNLLNMYKMAAHDTSTTHRNLFDLFLKEHGCDIPMLVRLMVVIKNVMTSGSQQMLTYSIFKGEQGRVRKEFDDIQKQFYEIRHAFDMRVWRCKSYMLDYAREDTRKWLREVKKRSTVDILNIIQKRLKMKYPEYTWAITGAEDVSFPSRDFDIRGDSYFRVDDDDDPSNIKVYYVIFGDTKTQLTCDQYRSANTFMVFRRCSKCSIIKAGDGILSTDKCTKSPLIRSYNLNETFIKILPGCRKCSWARIQYNFYRGIKCIDGCNGDPCKFCSGMLLGSQARIRKWDFMASMVSPRYGACKPDKCNGNGECKEIPYTKSYQCICKEFYEGEHCEDRVEFDDKIDKMMADLRQEFTEVNGVPTTVDVFFSLKDLKGDMERVWKNIKSSFDHTKQIIMHSDIIQAAEDLVDLYGRLNRNELSFERFGRKVDRYLKDVVNPYQLQNRMKKMILGEGMLTRPGNDIFSTFKREYATVAASGCTPRYNQVVKQFRDSLAYLDEAVGEILLLHKKWLINNKGTTKVLRDDYIKDAEYVKSTFSGRQEMFNKYWGSLSCGPMQVNGSNIECKNELSFLGIEVRPTCQRQKQPVPGSVKCVQINGTNVWESKPICKFVWGAYGNWGRCSKSCDGGVMYQRRTCIGTNDVGDCEKDQGGKSYRVKKCNTQACCSARYGKHKCERGRCIRKSQFCDGRNDCGDNEDESEAKCPNHVRSGMKVAFENHYKRHEWISCYCWEHRVSCWMFNNCKLTGCPGKRMTNETWKKCWGSVFFIYGLDRKENEAIRSGDKVGLRYKNRDYPYWFGCRSKHCYPSSCPEETLTKQDQQNCTGEIFTIYSPDRVGSCQKDASKPCIGRPIEHGDMIMLFIQNEKAWVCQWDYKIMKDKCGKTKFTKGVDNCSWQKWTISSEKGTKLQA